MKKGQVSSTRVFASSPIHGKSLGKHRHEHVGADDLNGAHRQSGVLVREVARAMEDQMNEDEQEPKTWKQKRQVSYNWRLQKIVHEADRIEGVDRVQDEMGKIMRHDDEASLSLWQSVVLGRRWREMA